MCAASRELERVLCVDDEPEILRSLTLTLRKRYAVTTAPSGAAGLEKLASEGPFAVVVSDMQMPSMDGPTFLAAARGVAPDSVRVVLTGRADQDAAIQAVNAGQIFRFLCKPCPSEDLVRALDAAAEQHRLITAERVLLEDTLRGSIRVLTNILSLVQPAAFGRASRILEHARRLARAIGEPPDWALEVAVMLSQLGCVTLPPETAERLYFGQALDDGERAMAAQIPDETERLLRDIPRLDGVRAILAGARRSYEPMAGEPKGPSRSALPLGSRILRLVTDYEALEARGQSGAKSLGALASRTGAYDPALLAALGEMVGQLACGARIEELETDELCAGMFLVEDMRAHDGRLLLARGNEITREMLARLQNLGGSLRIGKVRVSSHDA